MGPLNRRRFAPDVLEAMRIGHPMVLLERPGELAVHHSVNGLHLIGDADVVTAAQFQAAVDEALTGATGDGFLLLDLSRACFLSMTCAHALIHLLAGAAQHQRVEVHCSPSTRACCRRWARRPWRMSPSSPWEDTRGDRHLEDPGLLRQQPASDHLHRPRTIPPTGPGPRMGR
ncbi:STAS domain-containing protein [Streptomyces minutiscleroticus]|uniref:STAS domain-containing protein n=1 Tax=Streptomyces minutiscleroticus TaxID=68238 RepID=UPI00331AB8D1